MILEKLQIALYSQLSTKYTVYDYIPENPKYPYIYINDCVMQEDGCKTTPGYDVSVYLNIVSNYKGKKEIYEISQDIFETLKNIEVENASIHFSNNNLNVRCLKSGLNDGLLNIRYKVLNRR